MTPAVSMQRRIKLLLLIPHLGGGGAERVMAQLARHLNAERFEIHLGVIAQDLPGAESLPDSVEIHRLGCDRVRRAGLALLRLARTVQPDVILSGMAHLNFLVLLLRPLLPRQTRVLVRQNTTASASADSWRKRLPYRCLYPRADGIFCQSPAMADDLAENFAIARDKLRVLANPIDLVTAKSASPQPVWAPGAWPRLLTVGRLSREKGLDLLLRALPSILRQFPAAHVAVLGVGPEASSLQRLCEELALGHAVTFAGHRQNLADFYADTTLFVQPSRYEGMPNALLESAAAGLPIVATPSSQGICDLLRDEPGVWLSPGIDAESLAETIRGALANLGAENTAPKRFEHSFMRPFGTERAVAAYASVLERFAATHIAMVIPTIDRIGGAERQVMQISGELVARGYRVTVVALSGTGSSVSESLALAGVAYISLGMRKAWIDPRGWLRYLLFSRRERPEVVHTHLPHATWFARWIRLLAPVRVHIDTLHTSKTGGRAWRAGYRLTGLLSSQVTCVSGAVASAAFNEGLALRGNLRILHNGVTLPTPCRTFASGSRQNTPFRWIAVGRLAPVKDYPTLLNAFARLTGEPHLAIAGSGSDEAALRALAARLQVAGRVHFAGFRGDIQPLLEAADAFVLASLWEGLPVSVLEAAAAGLPVVATDGAGTREAILPGETGFLVPVGEAPALARAMEAIMQIDADERRAMGDLGRRFVAENFSLSVIADRWQKLYADLLDSHPRAGRWG
jgi:glycosyltransferase involved in cell wall biosynthesis